MKTFHIILSLLLVAVFSFSHAQSTTDEQLASHYFQSGEFDKAALYYEKLYKKTPTDLYYNQLRDCFIQTNNYKQAEKLVKKQLKTFPGNANYLIDLGDIYEITGNTGKAAQIYERAIKDLRPNQSQVIQLANAFLKKGKEEYALQTYLRGRKMLKDRYPLHTYIARVYSSMGRHEEMIEEYLGLLEVNEAYLQSVQNELQRTMSFEKDTKKNRLLKEQLLKRIQKNPGKKIYAEMLVWIYIQQKNFEGAFLQAKALDKRLKEQGGRLVDLARICASNGNYNLSVKCYKYVIEKGMESSFYRLSKTELLNTLNKKITSGNYTDAELAELESNYYSTFNELGRSVSTVPLMKELAHLLAYYLHKPDTSVALLEEAIQLSRSNKQLQGECKLDLGDILLIKGEIWDAALYYSQVDKDFKYDELGERAKFKRAKISYYSGDFGFAKGQLDVLKGSTSKLIANDALKLSLIITDNTGIDTTEKPLLLFATAELLFIQNKDSLALQKLDSVNKVYPNHSLDDEILFLKYQVAVKKRNYRLAADYLQKIADDYAWDILADNAVFNLAEIYQFHLNDLEKAKSLYETLLFDFPGSLFVVEARKRFRELRGDDIN
ncbi:MAG: hypothetical protein COA57_01635 [Flavobacteriales bacterium]|nr:MAG: hypothetical protein COA57_01635 [Flavobacteriales bacterium]